MSLELVVFTGLQASGKSSFYRSRFAETHALVSKDLFPNARNRNARQERLIVEAFTAGRSVVVDNTNPGPLDRAPLITLGGAHGVRVIGYAFDSDVRACAERNELRTGTARIPLVGLYATARRLQPPSLEEGFDELFRVRLIEGGFDVTPG